MILLLKSHLRGFCMHPSFGSLELSHRVRRASQLKKLSALIDCESLRVHLKNLYKRDETRGGGQIPFDELMMFKAVLLGQWHSLSDAKLEEALLVRLDFMDFCGLSLSDPVPDETTLCRFRLRLIKHNRLDRLLKAINSQLQSHGLMVEKAGGAVLDATLIESSSRPRRTIEIEVDDSGDEVVNEDGSPPGVVRLVQESADPDARWVKKGNRSYFGYRGYVTVDTQDGYVRGVHAASANEIETRHLERALNAADVDAQCLYADKGYASSSNRALLKERGIGDGIMHRAVRGKSLTDGQRIANRLIGRMRYGVEQCFGTLKRLFRMDRASYRGLVGVTAQLTLKCMSFNLLKAVNKIRLELPETGKMRPVTG
jgi:IS5 family transposase